MRHFEDWALLLAWVCPCGRAHRDEELAYGSLVCACGRVWHARLEATLSYEAPPVERVRFRPSPSRPLAPAIAAAAKERTVC